MAGAGCSTSGASVLTGSVARRGNTRSSTGGVSAASARLSSIPIVTAVQTACRAAALFTRAAANSAPASAAGARTRRETLHSSSISDLLPLAQRDPLRQVRQFLLADEIPVHHAEQQLLHRSSTEPVQNLPHRFHRHVLRPLDARIHEDPPRDFAPHVALILEPLENGAAGRFLHRMPRGQRAAHFFRGDARPSPQHLPHQMLELAERRLRFWLATHCRATDCSASRAPTASTVLRGRCVSQKANREPKPSGCPLRILQPFHETANKVQLLCTPVRTRTL